jgi:hypothetical protein
VLRTPFQKHYCKSGDMREVRQDICEVYAKYMNKVEDTHQHQHQSQFKFRLSRSIVLGYRTRDGRDVLRFSKTFIFSFRRSKVILSPERGSILLAVIRIRMRGRLVGRTK